MTRLNSEIGSDFIHSHSIENSGETNVIIEIAPGSKLSSFMGMDYINRAAVSLGNLFAPLNIWKTNNPLPYMSDTEEAISPNPTQRVTDQNGQHYRSSVEYKNLIDGQRAPILTKDESLDPDKIDDPDGTENVRYISFSSPFYLTGWCYDINGKPCPSVYDYEKLYFPDDIAVAERSGTFADYNPPTGVSPSASGTYATTFIKEMTLARRFIDDKKNTFDEFFATDTKLHKAGPIDYRWNDTRKVFQSGPQIKEGYLLTVLESPNGRLANPNYTSGLVAIYDGKGSDWRKIEPEKTFWVINRSMSVDADSGTYIVSMEMPNGEYRPIWVDCDPDPSGAPASYQIASTQGKL